MADDDMVIPDEVLTEAFGGIRFYEPYYSIHLKQAQVIARWARKEALKEAIGAIDALNGSDATGYYAPEAHSGYQEAQWGAEQAIRALSGRDT